MVKCPNCGQRKLILKPMKCLRCGKLCCEKCAVYVISLGYQNRWACSRQCAEKFEQEVLGYPLENVGTELNEEFDFQVNKLWHEACIAALHRGDPAHAAWSYLLKQGVDYAMRIIDIKSRSHDGKHATDLHDKIYKSALLALAHNMELVGRPLDAAIIYEKHLKMYDKARELREKQKRVTVKRVDISMNLNELLKQVKDGGIVAIFKCPHCGGKLRIGKETSIDNLRVCEYCGSEIQAIELVEFLKDILS